PRGVRRSRVRTARPREGVVGGSDQGAPDYAGPPPLRPDGGDAVSTASILLSQAKGAGQEQSLKILNQMRQEFVAAFGSFLVVTDLHLLDDLLVQATLAKVREYSSDTEKQAREARETYEACLESMETIGDKYEIVGGAKAGKLMK